VDDFGLAGKLFLPVSIVAAASMMPVPTTATADVPAPVVEAVDFSEMPPPVVNVTIPDYPTLEPPVVNVSPAEPVVVEEEVEVEVEVVKEVEVEKRVEVPVEVRTCLVWDELPHFDLTAAIMATRPGEAWSLSGDYYDGLNWLADTEKPTQTELIAGWLTDLEDDCDA